LVEKKSPLPVVLILVGDKEKAFLYKRTKRPYKNFLSLPGGRILLGESLEDASKRIMKNKFNSDVKLKKLNSVSFEQVKKSKEVVHSFILFFVTVTTKDPLELIEVEKSKKKIISSDYKLITQDSEKQTDVPTIFSKI
jgi:ADP-ribose pyrophosphatase YjhB (NUDIX family)